MKRTLLSLAIASAALSSVNVAQAAPEISFSGEVAFEGVYTDKDSSGSESEIVLDTADFKIKATDGAVKAEIKFDGSDGNEGALVDSAKLEYKFNGTFTGFMKYDDTLIGFKKKSMKWNDTLSDKIVDIKDDGAVMSGAKISGGPIKTTLYVTNGANGEDDLQNFGSQIRYSHDMFNAHFGYVSEGVNTEDQGIFSVAGDVKLGGATIAAEYNWLEDELNDAEPTFLQVAANYDLNGYSLTASYETTEDADAVGEKVEDRVAFAVAKDITDMLWIEAELDLDSKYNDDDDTSLYVAVGASF
jgi:hypothetical protein